jgi:Ca-activated chloride channel family protein
VRRALVVLLAAAIAAPASAQSPSPTARPPLIIGAEVELVSITAVIQDRNGQPVRGLGTKDVVVLEDGVPQELTYFREMGQGERIPLSVVLVLDTSGSMKKTLPFLQEAAVTFLSRLEPGDKGLVVSFNNGVRSSVEFTDDVDRMISFVEGLQAWGGTSLNDAIHSGLNRVRNATGRKAVVVFSDGADTTSSLNEKDVVEYARAVEATVYAVGFKGEGPGGTPQGFLKRVASETGGQHFFPGDVTDLIGIFKAIAGELQSHYAFAYGPKRAADDTFRTIEVRLTPPRKDVSVRVRKSYFAAQRRPARAEGE